MSFTIKYLQRKKRRTPKGIVGLVSVRLNKADAPGRAVLTVTLRNGAEKEITAGEYLRIGRVEEDPRLLILAPATQTTGHKMHTRKADRAVVKVVISDPEEWAPLCGEYDELKYDEEHGVHFVERARAV